MAPPVEPPLVFSLALEQVTDQKSRQETTPRYRDHRTSKSDARVYLTMRTGCCSPSESIHRHPVMLFLHRHPVMLFSSAWSRKAAPHAPTGSSLSHHKHLPCPQEHPMRCRDLDTPQGTLAKLSQGPPSSGNIFSFWARRPR